MLKHLKTSIIAIVLTFSFCFISKVYAYSYYGLELNQDFFNTLWSTIENKSTIDLTQNAYQSDYIFHQSDYPYVAISSNSNSSLFMITFMKDYSVFSTITTQKDFTIYWPNRSDVIQFFYYPNISTNNIISRSLVSTTNYNGRQYFWERFYIQDSSYWSMKKSVSNFTIPDRVTSSFDYSSSSQPYRFNFHLNGGHATTTYLTPVLELLMNDSEFSISSDDYDIDTFFSRLNINKEDMIFHNFYYDSNFTFPFNLNDNFDDHATIINDEKVINLYAKYRYKTVDDFIDDNNFTEYNFDTNYDYAIINRGNNNGTVYMGLPFNNYDLEVYEYQENNSTYKEGSSACLVPIFNKNNIYYYELNTLFTTNQEVLILPKQLFAELNPNDFDDPNDIYKFYLTSNAYVTYTNDLTHVTITNSQGQQVDTNLQNSFELSQQYKNLYANEKDIYAQIKIFLDNITKYTTAIKGMFQYLFNSLNSTIRSFIIFLVVLILLSTILRFIRRG